MRKKVMVLSLGGSVIIPKGINFSFLQAFKTLTKKYTKQYQFIIVCGGGSIARTYMSALARAGVSPQRQGIMGITTTQTNAMFVHYFFGKTTPLPNTPREIQTRLKREDIVICGALGFTPGSTTDTQAALLAKVYKTQLINITNVYGLYTSDPKTHSNATLIPSISWHNFEKQAKAKTFSPGQHFVLDQKAATIIRKHRIETVILGSAIANLEKFLDNKPFKGTVIKG